MRKVCVVAIVVGLASTAMAQDPTPPLPKDVPLCAQQCDDLSAAGELSERVNLAGCYVRVCQRESRQLYADGRYEDSLRSLAYIKEQLGASPAFLMDQGLAFYALGRFDEALVNFDRILLAFPNNIKAGAQRGHTLMRLNRLEDAEKQFQALIDNPSSDGEFRKLITRSYLKGNLGMVKLMQRGKTGDGKQDLVEALQIDPRNQLASTYLHNVVPWLDTGALDPEGVWEFVGAHEDIALGRFRDAAEKLQTLLRRQPGFGAGYYQLGEILRSYGAYAECEEVLRVGEKNLPHSVNLKAERLRCHLLKVGPTTADAKVAVNELKALADAHPENERVKRVLSAVGYDD